MLHALIKIKIDVNVITTSILSSPSYKTVTLSLSIYLRHL